MTTTKQLRQAQANAAKRAGVAEVKPMDASQTLTGLASQQKSGDACSARSDAYREKIREDAAIARVARWKQVCPRRYVQWTLANFSEDLRKVANDFLDGDAWSLYLYGGVGSRKTSFAMAIARRYYLEQSQGCLFVSSGDVAVQLGSGDTKAAAMAAWGSADLVILDDVGANRATPGVITNLLHVLQKRYDGILKTILTSNLDLTAFSSHIDDPKNPRIGSRLAPPEGMYSSLGQQDYRQAKG